MRLASRFGAVNLVRRDRPLTRDELAHYVPSVFSEENMNHAQNATHTFPPSPCLIICSGRVFIWNFYSLSNSGAFMSPDADSDEKWSLFNSMNGYGGELSAEAAGIAVCLMAYSHHACRTECDGMTEHYYRLRDYALNHPECSAIMHIID